MSRRFLLGNESSLTTSRYFDFLCRIVGKYSDYSQFLRLLHRIEFYSIMPNDDNRGADGLHLRELFCDGKEGPTDPLSCPQGPCTILEMFIGLSFRLEFETAQSKYEKTPSEWFWILVDNIGLTPYTNSYFYNGASIDEVTEIIGRFLERKYAYNGEGGLFPLNKPKNDQRLIEIWYQMSAYIIENYPLW